ncbi:MAG TPA: metal ABC transporter ATP-binding protein [Myxococcales bacterium]|nr:metal ABC transporter ATP-binding protein [Myxococcales bacterium]
MENALEVEGLTVRFGETEVFRDLSFHVAKGSSFGIIGPNGAGKTVLFKTLLGALPHTGSFRWAKDSRLGYVPQKLDIERDLPITGRELLAAKGGVSRAARGEVERVLGSVGLGAEVAGRTIGSLSGGQFQRLLVAFALVGKPNVLLFDEPTAGVDEPGQEGLHDTIQKIQAEQQLTLLLISHDISVIYRSVQQVLCLGRHRPVVGPPEECLTPQALAELYGAPVRFHVHDHAEPRP